MSSSVQLKQITSKIGSGATPRGGDSVYQTEGVALIRSQNVLDLRFSKSGLAFISEDQARALDNVTVKKDDVLLNITGDSIARVCKVPSEVLPARVNQHVSIIRCKDTAHNSYLLYFLQYLKPYLLKLCKVGGTRNALTKEAIEKLPITFHLNPEKRASVLSALDAKIELNGRINAELEAMAKTHFDYWFVQFDFPDKKGRPYKSSGGKMVYNEQLKRKIPEGWLVERLSTVFSSSRGISYSSKNTGGAGVPMINLASFAVSGEYNHDGLKFFSGDVADSKKLTPFSLVMCNTQQTEIDYLKDIIGKAFLVPDIFEGEVVSSHHVTHIRVSNESLKFYLHRLFNTDHFHKYVAGYCSGTNILGLIFSGVENYVSEMPPDEVLEPFADFMKSIEQRKSIVIKETQQLTELRDWLLPMLMNGQVQVR